MCITKNVRFLCLHSSSRIAQYHTCWFMSWQERLATQREVDPQPEWYQSTNGKESYQP